MQISNYFYIYKNDEGEIYVSISGGARSSGLCTELTVQQLEKLQSVITDMLSHKLQHK